MKNQEHLSQLVKLCKQPSGQRTQDNVWFIRDRLHECSSFFRLWPSQLQQLLCRLLQARQWVQNEVLVAAGTKPEDLCFIVDGQAAVAVRSAPGSSLLKDVALLHAGDTFGELCLLGKERHPAFVVARSSTVTGLTISAQALAAAMPAAPQQAAGRVSAAKGSAAAPVEAAAFRQDTVSVDALYQLIGQQPHGQSQAKLKPSQMDQVRELCNRQLQEAAAAEAATVGAWQQLPHQRIPTAAAQGRPSTASRSRPAADAQQAGSATAGQGVYEVKLGDVLAFCNAGAQCFTQQGEVCAQEQSADYEVPEFKQGTAAVEALDTSTEQQQQQQTHRSPLMHHATIMHFAALRAAAAGQPS